MFKHETRPCALKVLLVNGDLWAESDKDLDSFLLLVLVSKTFQSVPQRDAFQDVTDARHEGPVTPRTIIIRKANSYYQSSLSIMTTVHKPYSWDLFQADFQNGSHIKNSVTALFRSTLSCVSVDPCEAEASGVCGFRQGLGLQDPSMDLWLTC